VGFQFRGTIQGRPTASHRALRPRCDKAIVADFGSRFNQRHFSSQWYSFVSKSLLHDRNGCGPAKLAALPELLSRIPRLHHDLFTRHTVPPVQRQRLFSCGQLAARGVVFNHPDALLQAFMHMPGDPIFLQQSLDIWSLSVLEAIETWNAENSERGIPSVHHEVSSDNCISPGNALFTC
jgi:hypothetical protein